MYSNLSLNYKSSFGCLFRVGRFPPCAQVGLYSSQAGKIHSSV